MNTAVAAQSVQTDSRFTLLDAGGQPTEGANHVYVRDDETQLVWLAATVGKARNWEHAKELAASATILGGQARLPTRKELLSLVDDTRYDPAIDTAAFPDTKSLWYWTATPLAGNSDYAWNVSFGYGFCDWGSVYGGGFVRAVRSARGQ